MEKMLLDGEALQVIVEMKESLPKAIDTDKGWGQIKYFQKNVERMNYAELKIAYRERISGGCL